MKINKFIALAAIAMLVVGTMSVISNKAFAQGKQPPAVTDCNNQDDDDAEVDAPEAVDTDDVEEECGEQIEDGEPDELEEGVDDEVQEPSYTGRIFVDQAQTEGLSAADEAASLEGQATILASEAEAAALAANPGTAVVKTELDNENGVLVFSVELSNGTDVKVDAGNGEILFSDSSADSEG